MDKEYRIDELAQLTGTTVRNVRAYQDRGLLPPPRKAGRVGWYSEEHLARLRVINALLERGYSLQNIAELVQAWERGHNLQELLGLEVAVASPFTDEAPVTLSPADLSEVLGTTAGGFELGRAVEMGLVVPEGLRFRVPSVRLLRAGAELHRAGVPISDLLEEVRALRKDVNRIAARFVGLVVEHVFDRYGDDLPPAHAAPELAKIVQRLRPLAEMVVDTELAHALERQVKLQLGERIGQFLERRAAPAANHKKSAKPRR